MQTLLAGFLRLSLDYLFELIPKPERCYCWMKRIRYLKDFISIPGNFKRTLLVLITGKSEFRFHKINSRSGEKAKAPGDAHIDQHTRLVEILSR